MRKEKISHQEFINMRESITNPSAQKLTIEGTTYHKEGEDFYREDIFISRTKAKHINRKYKGYIQDASIF